MTRFCVVCSHLETRKESKQRIHPGLCGDGRLVHMNIEQQRGLAYVRHDSLIVLLANTGGHLQHVHHRASCEQIYDENNKCKTYNVKSLQKSIISKKDVRLEEVFVVRVDSSTNTAVCQYTFLKQMMTTLNLFQISYNYIYD